MVRWRLCLFLVMLLILPDKGGSKLDDDDDDAPEQPEEDEEEEDDDDDDSPPTQRLAERPPGVGRRPPGATSRAITTADVVTRTVPRRPLECYVCAYKAETQLRSCLDPTKYRVHTMICHSVDDKCFTSVVSKGSTYEAVMRGCRSGCVPSPDTTCCELNRCNNQALALPVIPPHTLTDAGKGVPRAKSNKTIPPSVLFFVTILLVLQTVVKVSIV